MIYDIPNEPPVNSILYDADGSEWNRTGEQDGWGNWYMTNNRTNEREPLYGMSWTKLLLNYGPLVDSKDEL